MDESSRSGPSDDDGRPDGIDWVEMTDGAYAKVAAARFGHRLVPAVDPDRVELEGSCPRCGHEFHFEWPLTIVRVRREFAPISSQVTVFCRCGSDHSGRPDDIEDGCGAYWNLVVPIR